MNKNAKCKNCRYSAVDGNKTYCNVYPMQIGTVFEVSESAYCSLFVLKKNKKTVVNTVS